MRISMEMSGFSAAKADKLRKAMGKKKLKDLEPLKAAWVEGAIERGYDPKLPDRMWTDIEKFAEYAFNKSHSAAYGVITMQTAYLKAHYPIEYMAAVLTSYSGKTDKIVHYVAECNRAGYTVLPPDVNSSGKDFTPVPARASASASRVSAESVTESSISSSARNASGGASHRSMTSARGWTSGRSTRRRSRRSSRPAPSTRPAIPASTCSP